MTGWHEDGHIEKTHAQYLKEIAARGKRIETRLTKYLISVGFESGSRLPFWLNNEVHVPTPSASLQDILQVIPPGWLDKVDDVPVVHDGKLLATLTFPSDRGEESVDDA